MLRGLRKKASILSLTSTTSDEGDSPKYDKILKQVHDFEVALKAMDYLLDDRTPEGTDLLKRKLKEHQNSKSDQPVGIFHLALGVMEFLEATLGFEPEIMAKAHKTLSEAENSSLENSKYNTKHHLVTSHIYPPGTEFQVTNAESTLLNALVMLLQENNGVMESAKALYKLRKAYHTLDSVHKKIKELEPVFNKNIAKLKKTSLKSNLSVSSVDLPGYTGLDNSSISSSTSSLPQDLKLIKDLENVFQMRKSRIEGTNIGNSIDPQKVNLFADSTSSFTISRKGSALFDKGRSNSPLPPKISIRKEKTPPTKPERDIDEDDEDEFSDAFETLNESELTGSIADTSNVSILTGSSVDDSSNYLHVSTVDEFIHSGVQLCFGILQVVLSLIPPAIGRVLSIVGFKGDRDVGLKLLWKNAITCRNIHGDLALLCLLIFYDGPVQFVDSGFQLPENASENISSIMDLSSRTTISDSELDKILQNPDIYIPQVLSKVRAIFPHNALWVLQEGRVLASHGQSDKAVQMMQEFTDDPDTKIQMQQSEALLIFDRATLYSFNHRFDEAAEDFIKLIDLNSWCRSAYLYMAGGCYVAKYRMIKLGMIKYDTEELKEQALKEYAEKAEKYIKLAPTYVPNHGVNATNRKGGIGGGNKQLPFDKFVLRKTKQLEERQAKYPNLPFIDTIATSPIHELIYFWNGYNRLTKEQLEMSLEILSYSGAANSEHSANTDDFNYMHITETKDEAMIRYFYQSIILRSLGKVKEGLNLLDTKVCCQFVTSDNPFKFTRLNYSPYLCPTVLYEKAMFVWLLKTSQPGFDVKSVVEETKNWLKKANMVSDVGDYELSNRTNMRIKAATEKVDQIGNF